MNEFFDRITGQFSTFFKDLSAPKRLASLILGSVIVVMSVILYLWADQTTYTPLMTNLGTDDATAIMRILRDKKIPFQIDVTGKNVSIPTESIYHLRLELASLGLPQTGVVGYEIFDKQSLGTSSFVQKMNQKRAQEGELIRTINSIRGVKHSRVHLAIPNKSAFLDEQKRPTASVVVDMELGSNLTDKQVTGIGNLVARSVEGLEANEVMIMNSDGKVLSKNSSDPLSMQTATQLEYQQKIEQEAERRIESILAKVLGEGRVVAKVTTDLDFSQINETQTLYDSDGAAVRSVEKHQDNMSGSRPGAQGAPGAASNIPGGTSGTGSGVNTQTSKNNEVTNYEVPQTIRKTSKSIGTVKRMSVAVIIDGKVIKTKNEQGAVVTQVQSWSPEKIKEFSDLVASAVGLDKKRGDTLEIKNIEFSHEDFEEAQRIIDDREQKNHIQSIVTYAVLGLAVLLFFLLVVRPFVKWVVENTVDSVDTFLPQTVEELERIQKSMTLPSLDEVVPILPENLDPNKVEGEMIKEKIITLVESNPHKAALIIRDWLHEAPRDKNAKDDKKKPTAAPVAAAS